MATKTHYDDYWTLSLFAGPGHKVWYVALPGDWAKPELAADVDKGNYTAIQVCDVKLFDT